MHHINSQVPCASCIAKNKTHPTYSHILVAVQSEEPVVELAAKKTISPAGVFASSSSSIVTDPRES